MCAGCDIARAGNAAQIRFADTSPRRNRGTPMRSFMKKALIVATVFVVPAAVAGVSWWSATVTTDGLAPESMRAELASGILRDWSGEAAARKGTSALTWSTAMQSTLRNADIANLERAAGEPTFDGMQAALLGTPSSLRAGATAKVASPTSDLVFTPVTPCRIVDTRVAGGPIAQNNVRSFVAYSASGFASQGGQGTNCGVPADAAAIHVHLTASHPAMDGYFTAYPSDVARPLASSLNYFAGVDTAAGEIISLCRPGCGNHFTLYTYAQSNAVIDVTGYYMEPVAAALDCTVAQQTGNLDLLSGLQMRSVSCPAGYAATGGGCGGPLGIGVSNSQPLVTSGQPTGWSCDMVGSLLSVISYQVSATCCRTAGR